MATVVVIPTIPGTPYYTTRTKLDGREYNLRFAWNDRAQRWSMDIYTEGDVPLVVGMRLVAFWPLLRFYQWDKRVPPGKLVVFDLSEDKSPPGLFDLGLGLRCELTYISAD